MRSYHLLTTVRHAVDLGGGAKYFKKASVSCIYPVTLTANYWLYALIIFLYVVWCVYVYVCAQK